MAFMEFTGIRVITPYSWEYENCKVAVSYMTVLIYKDGENVAVYYPSRKWDDAKRIGEIIRERCENVPQDVAERIGAEVLKVVVFDD